MKNKKKFPVWLRVIIGVIIVIVGIALLLSSMNEYIENENFEDSRNIETKKSDDNKYITLDKFNQIQNGMSYEEVKEIVGSAGTVISDTQVEGYNMIIYSWYGKDGISNANFNFENDKLINKTQIGLE